MHHYRLDRIREQMARHEVALCLLNNPVNLRYAIDYAEYQLFQAHIPTAYLMLPRNGPISLYGSNRQDYPFVGHYRVADYSTVFDAGTDLSTAARAFADSVVNYLREIGEYENGALIALERFSPHITEELLKRGCRITDAEAILEQARAIKSIDEIACIRHSIAIAEHAIQHMRNTLRPGMREAELWSILHQININHGGGWVDGHMLCSGPRTNPWYQEVSQRVIEKGDMVALDSDMIGPTGYLADISRSWLCGDEQPSVAQHDAYQHAYEEIQFNMQRLRPGISFRELSEGGWPRREAYRQQHYVCCYHGVGLCDEYPKIYYPEDWDEHGYDGVLQSGMVLSVESYSGIVGGEVGVKLEDIVLVTENGPEKLTASNYEKSLLM